MQIKYEGTKYSVSFIQYIKVRKVLTALRLKRIKRNILKHYRSNGTLLLLLSIVWLLWCGIKTIYEGVIVDNWNFMTQVTSLSDDIFGTVVITIAINVYYATRDNKLKLKQQYNLYVETMYCFDELIYPFLNDKWAHYPILYYRPAMEKASNHITSEYMNMSIDEYFESVNDALSQIKKVQLYVHQNGKVGGMGIDYLETYIAFLRKHLIAVKASYENKQTISEEIKQSISIMYEIIAQLRMPWRWDIDEKIYILNVLKIRNSKKILEDTYDRTYIYEFEDILEFIKENHPRLY